MRRKAIAVVCLVIASVATMVLRCGRTAADRSVRAQFARAQFDTSNDLAARHPELANTPGYAEFTRTHTIRGWAERPASDSALRILTIYTTNDSVFAASFTRARTGEKSVGSTKTFPATEVRDARRSATDAFKRAQKVDLTGVDQIVAAPQLTSGQWLLGWEVTVGLGDQRQFFSIDPSGNVKPRARRRAYLRAASYVHAAFRGDDDGDDDLAANELHHPADYATRPSVIQARTRTNTLDQVLDILFGLNEEISIGSQSKLARAFTLSDREAELTQAGACDEWSVIVISYMRALNVRAHLRFLTYDTTDGPGAHAFLEVQDTSGSWIHVDPTWDVWDRPATYQCLRNRQLFDIAEPYDALSSDPVQDPDDSSLSIPDPVGDSMLAPWRDFKKSIAIPLGQYAGNPAVCATPPQPR